MFPEWLDGETLRVALLVLMAVLSLVAVAAMRFVRRLLLRAVVLGLFVALIAGLWQQRSELGDCVDTCSCSLFGQQVHIPKQANPICT